MQVRVSEEAAHQVWQPLQPVERRQRLGFEVIGAGNAGAADPVVLDVLPHPLVRVQFRRIPRKNSRSRPPVDAANALTALERCTGWPSRTRNTGPGASCSSRRQKSMNTGPFKLPS